MKDTVQKSFNILKNNLLFIQPLLMYLLLVMTLAAFVVHKNIYIVPRIISVISIFLLTAAFTAGWFYINKAAVLDYNSEDTKETITVKSINNLKKFFEGIGECFLRTLGIYLVELVIYVLVVFLSIQLFNYVFGFPQIFMEIPKIANAASQTEIINMIKSFSVSDMAVFVNWTLSAYAVLSVLNYFFLLYFTISFFEKNNIFSTLLKTIKFFFKHILNSVLIMIIMFIIHIGLNIISILLGNSSVAFVILTILFTLYLNYYVLLVFCFYYDKTKIDSNNGAVSIGEN